MITVFRKLLLFVLAFGAFAGQGLAQRVFQSMNSNWLFLKKADTAHATWSAVSVPHTWNAMDVMDDVPGYHRGISWYRKSITVPAAWRDKEIYLHFEGANQRAVVYVNNRKVGEHVGGYTAFRFRITSFLHAGSNVVAVELDNSQDKNIAPLSGDFSFYGGIYRDVYLLAVDKLHFSLDDHASPGVFINTPIVSAENAGVVVKGNISNYHGDPRKIRILTRIFDRNQNEIAKQTTSLHAASYTTAFKQVFSNIKSPHLWSPADPYLYTVVTSIIDATGKSIDELRQPLGFRWFRFDAAEGFFLNGKPLKLIGASRHQDFKGIGNALPDARHVKDVELLKQMGANFLRIAHYPQDPAVLQACDRLGILVAEEIPLVNEISETDSFRMSALQMQREMIRQHYNHPSVILWGYMNEVLLKLPYTAGSAERKAYLFAVKALAGELEMLTRREDGSRYTMMALHGAFDLYHGAGLTTMAQVTGWNLYQGWYSPGLENFEKFVERHRRELPGQPLLISEYGADADPRIHSTHPERFDKSLEYALEFHKTYLAVIRKEDFIAGATIWNLADFNAEHREESMPHINNKGITTTNREPKDIYYFYQSHLADEPYLHIGTAGWKQRVYLQDTGSAHLSTHTVSVFTNQHSVTLWHNGVAIGTQPTEFNVAQFRVPFVNGVNRFEASANAGKKVIKDGAAIDCNIVPRNLLQARQPFIDLNINLGDARMFIDDLSNEQWLPEKEYSPGSFGYVGGDVFRLKNGRQSFGTAKAILATENDPVYATQRHGIKTFRFDVPAGDYELTLHFAELSFSGSNQMVFNLDSARSQQTGTERAFDVTVNGTLLLADFGAAGELPPNTAVVVKTGVPASDKGITIDFHASRGTAILNGVQLKKIY